MAGWLTTLGPEGTALALLLLGHVLGDFVFQTDRMARSKHRLRPLLTHAAIVTIVHLVAFTLFLTQETALLVLAIGVSHLLVDAVSARLRPRDGTSTVGFLADQGVHLLVLLVVWHWFAPITWTAAPAIDALGGVQALPWTAITAGAVYVSAFAFAHEGGNALVRGVLPEEGPETQSENDLEAGSLIGTLERWVVLALGLAGLWEAVAIVVAAKSVARFEELKKRAFAEYFLVGTLASLLVAIALVVIVSVLV